MQGAGAGSVSPMVIEVYGAWGVEAMESLSRLASRLATSSNKTKAVVLAYLYGRLNLNLARANATAIVSSLTCRV